MGILKAIKSILFPLRIQGKNNRLVLGTRIPRFNHFVIRAFGNDNQISIGKDCLLSDTDILLLGNDNHLIIEDKVRFMGPCRIRMGGNSTLHIKYNAGIRGVEFNVKDGIIEVGELCMFSHGIILRNHDSHKILDPRTGIQLNLPKDITLGNHVWIGQNVTILKGCNIGSDSVIGTGSIVTKGCEPGSVITGVPARVVKDGITWDY